jgi:hypothetical protein
MHPVSDRRERPYAEDLGAGALEQHLTVAELANVWKLNQTTIRRIFQDEPGVLKIGILRRRDGKRDYLTLRIPRSVAERVYRERTR